MPRKPRAIGTEAETATERFLRDNGFPGAERRVLRGRLDQGDIRVTAEIIAQVKAGEMAYHATDADIAAWLAETETQRLNAGADLAVLVVRRFRRPPFRWHAWMTMSALHTLAYGYPCRPGVTDSPVMVLLGVWCQLARRDWGDPA